MNNTLGKHLLIDCYGCKLEKINTISALQIALADAINYSNTSILDTYFHQDHDAFIVTAMGIHNHVCIHSYPEYLYLAIDIYKFENDIDPTQIMKILRLHFHPDKMKATSIKRGSFDLSSDMKPKVKSKTTTLRRVKNTGQKLKNTGGKMLRVLRSKNNKRP